MIIGLNGRKRSGKNTVAKILQRQHPGVCVELGLADPIKDAAALWFDLEHPLPDEKREVIDERWNMTPRQIWQLLGTEVGRNLHPDVWLRFGLRRAAQLLEPRIRRVRDDETAALGTTRGQSFVVDQPSVAIITDVRFPNEATAIRDAGGIIWTIFQPAEMTPVNQHLSEQGLPYDLVDYFLENKGSLEDLESTVASAWRTTVRW